MKDYAPDLTANSGELVETYVARDTAGRIYDVSITYTGASDCYGLLFDAAAVPSPGAVPLIAVPLKPSLVASSAGILGGWSWPKGRPMRAGCVVVLSSTAATYTAHGADEAIIDVTLNPH